MCGALRASDAGKKTILMGWVNRRRDLGNLIFVDVRDRSGVTQVVFSEERNAALHEKAELLRNEFVIAVIGTVRLRDTDTVNRNIPTGEVELVADELIDDARMYVDVPPRRELRRDHEVHRRGCGERENKHLLHSDLAGSTERTPWNDTPRAPQVLCESAASVEIVERSGRIMA